MEHCSTFLIIKIQTLSFGLIRSLYLKSTFVFALSIFKIYIFRRSEYPDLHIFPLGIFEIYILYSEFTSAVFWGL